MPNEEFFYKYSATATSYAQLCAVLAGFAFASLTLFISAQIGKSDKSDKLDVDELVRPNDEIKKFIEVTCLAFFVLLFASIFQTVIIGQPDGTIQTVLLVSIVSIITGSSIVLFICSVFAICSNFADFFDDFKDLLVRPVRIFTFMAVFFSAVSMLDLWRLLVNPNPAVLYFFFIAWCVVPILALVSFTKYAAKIQKHSYRLVMWTIMIATALVIGISAFVPEDTPAITSEIFKIVAGLTITLVMGFYGFLMAVINSRYLSVSNPPST